MRLVDHVMLAKYQISIKKSVLVAVLGKNPRRINRAVPNVRIMKCQEWMTFPVLPVLKEAYRIINKEHALDVVMGKNPPRINPVVPLVPPMKLGAKMTSLANFVILVWFRMGNKRVVCNVIPERFRHRIKPIAFSVTKVQFRQTTVRPVDRAVWVRCPMLPKSFVSVAELERSPMSKTQSVHVAMHTNTRRKQMMSARYAVWVKFPTMSKAVVGVVKTIKSPVLLTTYAIPVVLEVFLMETKVLVWHARVAS
jgi:hypothetical protein